MLEGTVWMYSAYLACLSVVFFTTLSYPQVIHRLIHKLSTASTSSYPIDTPQAILLTNLKLYAQHQTQCLIALSIVSWGYFFKLSVVFLAYLRVIPSKLYMAYSVIQWFSDV